MLTIKNTEVLGLERALLASGNPMTVGEIDTSKKELSDKDNKRAKALGSNPVGSAHDHYLMGVHVQADILYPQYWTIEAERYHWFGIISSQSKMHRLIRMGTTDEFSLMFNEYVDVITIERVQDYIIDYNDAKRQNAPEEVLYTLFMKCISNLPMGFSMWMTIDTNYLQLKTMYLQRKEHKLKEDWGAFCEWCEELPMFLELITKE